MYIFYKSESKHPFVTSNKRKRGTLAVNKNFKVREIPPVWGLVFPQTWVVEHLIPAESVIMISGDSGSGKSSLALAMADAISKGEPFLGNPTVKTPVLILDRENGLPTYNERLPRFGIENNPDLIIWGGWVDEPTEYIHPAIQEFARTEHPVIIYDSFVAFHPGNEQDASETRKYMDTFRKLAALGATVILIHHTGKGENTKVYRGSSDIRASVDVLYVLKAKKPLLQQLELKPDKVREGILEAIQITLDETKFVPIDKAYIPQDDKDWRIVCNVVEAHPGLNQSQILKFTLDMPAQRVRKILIAGELNGTFAVAKGLKNASFYSLSAPKNAQ